MDHPTIEHWRRYAEGEPRCRFVASDIEHHLARGYEPLELACMAGAGSVLGPASVQHYSTAIDHIAKRVCAGKQTWVWTEREPTNQYDANAIRVMARFRGWIGERRMHIGYLKREAAAELAGLDSAGVVWTIVPIVFWRPESGKSGSYRLLPMVRTTGIAAGKVGGGTI